MNYNKIDFINDLLSSKKIKIEEKSRIIDLTKNELKNFEADNSELKLRVDKIENTIKRIEGIENIAQNLNEQEIIQTNAEEKSVNDYILPDYNDPKLLSQFLRDYNQNPILKYTCHEIDDLESFLKNFENESFSFDKYLELILKEYKKLSSNYFGKINDNIKGLIWAYLNGTTAWSTDKIKISWGSKELKLWSDENPQSVPNPGLNLRRKLRSDGFEFNSFHSKITGKSISTFSNLVIHFKHLFHIRYDNSLKSIIEKKNTIENYNERIIFQINLPENIEFFTDVNKIVQAYQRIIEMILEFVEVNHKEQPIINLSLYELKDQIIFSIHHLNSTFGKTAHNCINRPGDKERDLINNQINGVCQLKLIADFGESNFAEINLWDGNSRKATKIKKIEGVEFQLIL